jgi:hypothetical protein
MLPARAHLAHRGTYFAADTTYKTTKGDIKQFRICTMDPELAERKYVMITALLSLYIALKVENLPLFI